ncbi:FadR/GntR family transcriptional regulator [Cloacibacillus evryensis]|uniref:Putative L-lactate dehydrogenase operon regulatory protein n=1 Tax=bioreactor metagenome TaxID=1076179 RepID=A0A645D5D4_9ZZZZ|nr:FadR/GntR family transcriptional regulator [Cloacibacillus evryensis]EXG78689.1 transcriptional regulator [Cloacibacillus evryensis DSM 19522]MEA5035497.1 FadR/GntR family transcriptional regulator [Cloacibacillus evryensis]
MKIGIPFEKKESKKKIVQDKLRELVSSGPFNEGDKLPSERELAQMLDVSRNVLREAVISMVAEGSLEVRERQGTFIKSLDSFGMHDSLKSLQMLPADFVSYQLEVRLIIEVPAAKIAAMRRTDNDIRKLRECYESFIACPYVTPEEQAQNGKWEALLHHLVTESAHNPILSRLNESINSLVERNNILVHPDMLMEKGWIELIKSRHAAIIRAIEEKNPEEAGETLKTHLLETAEVMRRTHPELITDIPSPYWKMNN